MVRGFLRKLKMRRRARTAGNNGEFGLQGHNNTDEKPGWVAPKRGNLEGNYDVVVRKKRPSRSLVLASSQYKESDEASFFSCGELASLL